MNDIILKTSFRGPCALGETADVAFLLRQIRYMPWDQGMSNTLQKDQNPQNKNQTESRQRSNN